MPIRLSGLVSNMDTDSMVKELVKASSKKKTDFEKAQTKLGWKQEAWKGLNTKIYNLFNKTLNSLRSEGNYNKKSTTVADSSIASVVAGNGAVNGSQTLWVEKMAKAGHLTGGRLSEDKRYDEKTTMETLGAVAAGETAKIKVTSNGKEKTIELTSDMKISDLVTKLGEAGVTASFDKENQRFFINSKNSGVEGDFKLTAEDSNGLESLSKLRLLTASGITNNPEYTEWAAMKGATDADTMANPAFAEKVTAEMAARAAQLRQQNIALVKQNEEIAGKIVKLEEGKDKFLQTDLFKDAMKAIDPSGTGTLEENIAAAEKYLTDSKKESARLGELQKKLVDAGGSLDDAFTAEERAEWEDLRKKAEDGAWDKVPEFEKNLSVLNVAKDYNDEIKAGNDLIAANQGKIDDNSLRFTSTIDADGKETIAGTELLKDEVSKDLVAKVNAAKEAIDKAGSITTGGVADPVRIIGKNAIIKLNGAEYTSSSNTFTVNGLTITAKKESTEETTINTDTDIEGIYNQVKDFLTEYNGLISEMDSLYNAKSAKGYEPLTKEEKDAMGESEIKEWEKKVKDSLLRRDSSLNSVTSLMKSAMLEGFNVNGERLSLTSFGIETQSYFNAADNQKGVYHIAGDLSDSVSSAQDDLLKTAIAGNPEKVGKFFSKFAENAYQKLNEEMRTIKDYRSVYHVYDDKKMASDYKDYTDKIAKQEKKLAALEDRYYKQFTAMEKAMSKLNSSQSSLTSLLGGG